MIAIRNYVEEFEEEIEKGKPFDNEKCDCKITQEILLEALEQTKPTKDRAIAVVKDMRSDEAKKDMGFA